MPVEKIAGLLAVHCLVRGQAPEDYELMIVPRESLLDAAAERAQELAEACGGEAISWDDLDGALCSADIVISSTGAPEPIVDSTRYQKILTRRQPRPIIILDLAVPREVPSAK